MNDDKIESSGAEAIAPSLTKNQTMLTVGLSNNSIGNHGGTALAEATRQTHSIVDVFAEGNRGSNRVEDEMNRICHGKDDIANESCEYQLNCHDAWHSCNR